MHACMTHVRVYYSMAHCICLFNIRSVELHNIYPAPEHGYGRMVLFSSESVHDLCDGRMDKNRQTTIAVTPLPTLCGEG